MRVEKGCRGMCDDLWEEEYWVLQRKKKIGFGCNCGRSEWNEKNMCIYLYLYNNTIVWYMMLSILVESLPLRSFSFVVFLYFSITLIFWLAYFILWVKWLKFYKQEHGFPDQTVSDLISYSNPLHWEFIIKTKRQVSNWWF